MKLKIKSLLSAVAMLALAGTCAEAADFRIEGEKFSKINAATYSIVLHDNFSEKDALFINTPFKLGDRVWVEYDVKAPESGIYSVEGVVGRYNCDATGNIHFSVNGGEEYLPDFTKIEDYNWWISGRQDYASRYTLGNIRLNKGLNKLRLMVAEQDMKVDKSLVPTLVDYLDFTKVSPPFEIKSMRGITDTANLFVKGESVKIKMDFSNDAPAEEGLEFVLEDVWERKIDEGKIVFAEGSKEYILNFGNLPVGWYRMKILSGNLAKGVHKEFFFSVVAPLSEVSQYNDKMTMESGVGFSGNMLVRKRLVKSLEKLGVKRVREQIGEPGYLAMDDDTYYPSHTGTMYKYFKDSGISVASGYSFLSWMMYRWLPEDLMLVYNMNKRMASYNLADEYEIWNEQDGTFLFEPAERFTSYFKAAALGVNDGSDSAKAFFGGLSGNGNDAFDRLMLSNDIMNYSDYYVYHGHTNTPDGKVKLNYPLGRPLTHIGIANAYEHNKPVWMNEGGVNISVDEDGVAYFDSQITQARYYIVSTAQGLSVGDDIRSYFRFGYFMELGKTYGCHTKNLNPHVIVSSMAAFNNAVGKADYKGELCNLPEGVEGYLFDSGKSDVAVVWCESADVINLTADKALKITDFVGAENYITPVGGKATVPVSYYPIFITFDSKMAEDEYIPANRKLQTGERKEYAENDRIVIQQIWDGEDLKQAKSNGYRVDFGEEQKITLKLYNFNETEQSGTIKIKTGSRLVDGDLLVPDVYSIEYKISPMSVAVYPVTVKLSDKAKAGDAGWFMVEGTLADGRELSPSKAKWTTSNEGRVIEDYGIYEGWDNAENWDTSNVDLDNCKASITYSEEEEALLFDLNFTKSTWAWPRMTVADMQAAKGSDGITFKVKNAVPGTNNLISVFTYYEDGTNYWLTYEGHYETTDEWTQIVIPWKEFVMFSSALGVVDTRGYKGEYIHKIGIGSDKRLIGQQKFYLKDIGYYNSDTPSDTDEFANMPEITGISEGESYASDELNNVTVKLSDYNWKLVKVLLNEEEYSNYTVENNVVTVNLNGLNRGKYVLEASAQDEWDDVDYVSVNFYVE